MLNGNLHELERLTGETERFCRECSLSPEVQFDLTLALEELFCNSIKHGGCEGMEKAVHVRLEAVHGEVRVEFRDRGRVFDPTTAPGPDLANIGGLGIHLVRGIMRDIHYERKSDWNHISMRRPL